MKIYVDELPKNCKECEYFSDWLDDGGCYQCSMPDNQRPLMYPKEILERSKTCPLQSIADHDAEKAVEVLEKVKTLWFPSEYRESILEEIDELTNELKGEN